MENNTTRLEGIKKGINNSADIIVSTMGGLGKNVLIFDRDTMSFTKDGVSVAKKIKFPDPEENAGARLLINAANKTVEQCGDGTTLTSLFIREFMNSMFEQIKTRPINEVIEEVKDAISQVVEKLFQRKIEVESLNEINKIALTSSKSKIIASLIEEIYRKTGFKANISVEMSRHFDTTYYEVTEGLSFEGGMIHNKFANQENGTCVFEKCLVYIIEETADDPEDYIKLFEDLHQRDIPILMIAPTYSDRFVRNMATNAARGLQICLVRTPGYGSGIKENIKDIKAFVTDNIANKVVVDQYGFIIYNNPDKTSIKKRCKQLESMIESTAEEFYAHDYKERINRLNQSSAIIYVGGVTEKNAKEEFDRIEDAVGAVKAAFKKGYVRGAGVELAHISNELLLKPEAEYIREILKKPYNQIMSNSNLVLPLSSTPYNVTTKQYDESIIDPVYVLENALINSFALIELIINTSYLIHE